MGYPNKSYGSSNYLNKVHLRNIYRDSIHVIIHSNITDNQWTDITDASNSWTWILNLTADMFIGPILSHVLSHVVEDEISSGESSVQQIKHVNGM